MKENKRRAMLTVGHCAAAGALMGLLVGAVEAVYRYRHPSPPFLLQPDVSYVIFLLGSLVDGLAAGFLGLVTGLFVASRSSRVWRHVALILGATLTLAMAIDPGDVVGFVLGGRSPTHFFLDVCAVILLAGAGFFISGLLPSRTLSVLLVMVFAILVLGVGVYALSPSLPRAGAATKPSGPVGKPNIILITLDTVRADHLSLHGYPRRTSPNIDKWARQGVVFENAIAPSSWTLTSHASMFTGLFPHQHGADYVAPLDPGWWTLADVLSSWGYETAGFTSNLGYGLTGWGLGNGFAFYDDDGASVRHTFRSLRLGTVLFQPLFANYVLPDDMDRRDASQINRDVFRWFHHRSAKPFYLFINYFDAHAPYLVPRRYSGSFGHVSPWFFARIGPFLEEGNVHLPSDDQNSLITSYDNCLAFLDESLGELLDSLSRLPGWENTVVIITSDHGEAFGEHGPYTHGYNLYREVLHVPLIILGPHIPAGLRITHVVRIQEIFETVLRLAGMDIPPFERGSLERFWRSGYEPGDSDEFVVSELIPEKIYPTTISVTTSEWQYLQDARGSQELYRWVSDPGEKFNLAQSPQGQGVLKDLQNQLRATVAESLRPWRRPEYLSALGGSDRPLAPTARLSLGQASTSAPAPRVPVGTSQAFFPHRPFTSTQPPPTVDQELLRSLPYH